MAGNILIADGVVTNRIWLRTKLCTASYAVHLASCARDVRDRLAEAQIDVLIVGSSLSDIDAPDLCRLVRKDRASATIPIIAIADPGDRARQSAILSAGADTTLNAPVDEHILLARLRSLLRGRDLPTEFGASDGLLSAAGFAEPVAEFRRPDKISVVAPRTTQGMRLSLSLRDANNLSVSHTTNGHALKDLAVGPPPDAIVLLSEEDSHEDTLRLLAEFRARRATRFVAMVVVSPGATSKKIVSAFDLGADEVIDEVLSPDELSLRLAPVLDRKRRADRSRARVRDGLRAALVDPLTGLHNRRYAMPALVRMAADAHCANHRFAVMIADLDHFKGINDRYGHATGDAVLMETSRRLKSMLSDEALLARIGGEEFLIALPDATLSRAREVAGLICASIADVPVELGRRHESIPITISVGVALSRAGESRPEDAANRCLANADKALYGAKSLGRNKVTFSKTAA